MDIGNPNTSIMQISDKGNILQFVEKTTSEALTLTYSSNNLLVKNFNTNEYFMPIMQRTEDGKLIKTKVIAIGNWDMDTTDFVDIIHSLGTNWQNVLSVAAFVRMDDLTRFYNIARVTYTTGVINGAIASISSTFVTLVRTTGGAFDSASFSGTGFSRGYISITYFAS